MVKCSFFFCNCKPTHYLTLSTGMSKCLFLCFLKEKAAICIYIMQNQMNKLPDGLNKNLVCSQSTGYCMKTESKEHITEPYTENPDKFY